MPRGGGLVRDLQYGSWCDGNSSGAACGDPGRPKLGVVIPLANEAGSIRNLLADVLAWLRPDDAVFCVVDRASRDDTLGEVRRAAAGDHRINVAWSPENTCVADAYFRGYRDAIDGGCGWILEMDAGYSHDPRDIPRFLEAMERGVDFAAGCRFHPSGRYSGNLFRRALSLGGTRLANLLLGTRLRDMTGGFECFTRRALLHVIERGVESRGPFFQTEIRYMLRGWRSEEVPILYRNPSGAVGGKAVLEALRVLLRLSLRRRKGTRGGGAS